MQATQSSTLNLLFQQATITCGADQSFAMSDNAFAELSLIPALLLSSDTQPSAQVYLNISYKTCALLFCT
jgi:hypothetical protein